MLRSLSRFSFPLVFFHHERTVPKRVDEVSLHALHTCFAKNVSGLQMGRQNSPHWKGLDWFPSTRFRAIAAKEQAVALRKRTTRARASIKFSAAEVAGDKEDVISHCLSVQILTAGGKKRAFWRDFFLDARVRKECRMRRAFARSRVRSLGPWRKSKQMRKPTAARYYTTRK